MPRHFSPPSPPCNTQNMHGAPPPPSLPPSGRWTNTVAVTRLREELETSNARVEDALEALEESRARAVDKADDETLLKEEGDDLRSRLRDLEGKNA